MNHANASTQIGESKMRALLLGIGIVSLATIAIMTLGPVIGFVVLIFASAALFGKD